MLNTDIQETTIQDTITNSRQSWRKVRFGDVVRNVDISERDPLTSGIDRYVGLEHIDPESLHITRWGNIEEGTSFTRKFVAGQVLFGKRRAYQGKVAIAEFDGICSGDILVFEAKDDLIPELLHFIVQSEGFYKHALNTSAGSLSPRTKWKDLAAYEFALPPKDEQRQIAEILWASENLIQKTKFLVSQHKKTKQVLSDTLLSFGIDENGLFRNIAINDEQFKNSPLGKLPKEWEIKQLNEIVDSIIDFRGRTPKKIGIDWGGDIPALSANNVEMGRINLTKETNYGSEKMYERWMTRGDTKQGDIVITMEAPLGNIAQIPDNRKYILSQRVLLLKTKQSLVSNNFLKHLMMGHSFQSLLTKYATGTTAKGIQQSRLVKLQLAIPPIFEQHRIAIVLDACDTSMYNNEIYYEELRQLKASLLQKLLM